MGCSQTVFVWCKGTFVYTAGAAVKMWESGLLRMHISASCEQKHLRLPVNENIPYVCQVGPYHKNRQDKSL